MKLVIEINAQDGGFDSERIKEILNSIINRVEKMQVMNIGDTVSFLDKNGINDNVLFINND